MAKKTNISRLDFIKPILEELKAGSSKTNATFSIDSKLLEDFKDACRHPSIRAKQSEVIQALMKAFSNTMNEMK